MLTDFIVTLTIFAILIAADLVAAAMIVIGEQRRQVLAARQYVYGTHCGVRRCSGCGHCPRCQGCAC